MLLGITPISVKAQDQTQYLQWTKVDKPGLNGNVVVHPSDVSEIAVGQSAFYAIDKGQNKMYRSLSGGLRWEDISSYLIAAGATLPVEKIAIAPDQAAVVVAATDGGTALYLSIDGGITWWNMSLSVAAGTTVQSIDISRTYGENNEQRDILIGTADFSNSTTTGQVQLLHLGSYIPVWKDLDIRVDPSFIGGDVSAVEFSPSYTDDQTILALASTNTDVTATYQDHTYLCIGFIDMVTFEVDWTSKSPVEIPPGSSLGDGSGSITGGLAVPDSFSATGASGKSPLVYAFYTVYPTPGTDPSNVYQINLNLLTVTAFAGVGTGRYSSIALSGNKLLAGEATSSGQFSVPVRISINADSTYPVFSFTGSPYGQQNAMVAWNSGNAYCGTSGDESGFSVSDDNGGHWTQVGLIDTTVELQDVAVASGPQSIFITSHSVTNVESVWRSAGEPYGASWGRILATSTLSKKLIVRISPNYRDDYTVCVCEAESGLPQINSFTADPSINLGNSATLQWNVTGATAISIDQGIGAIAPSGTQTVSPTTTTTYTLTAINGAGSVTAMTTVNVTSPGLPEITTFTATPGNIALRQSSTIQWNVTGATSVSIDQKIGTVSASGTFTVTLDATTTYTLTASNASGTVIASTTVTVAPVFWVSHDRGNAWKRGYAPPGIIDMAVANKEIYYIALPEGKTAKSITSGLFWQDSIYTGLPEINMLSLYNNDTEEEDTLFVGGTHGDVAYSCDSGESYTQLHVAIPGENPVQLVADTNYVDNHVLYAGSSNIIYRWIIDENSNWDSIGTADIGTEISGMVAVDSILYGLWFDTTGTGSGAERCLEPTALLSAHEWDTIEAGAESDTFDAAPTSLRYTTTKTDVILWAIDTTGDTELMIYRDCLAFQSPPLTMDDGTVIGCDPASGRNQEVNFTWDAICVDDRYQLQVAKDAGFTMEVFDSGDDYPFLLPADIDSPTMVYFQGGGNTSPSLQGISVPALECGHTFYWRVRARAATTGDIIRSPWSEVYAFTIKAGFQVTTPYMGPQLMAPDNGCGCECNSPVCFSWTPFKETTLYQFELSENADMSSPLVSTKTETTAYQYDGQLECNNNYFWRVMAVQPAPSEWSTTFSFRVQPKQTTSSQTVEIEMKTPFWVWITIATGSLSVLMIIVLIVKVSIGEKQVDEDEFEF